MFILRAVTQASCFSGFGSLAHPKDVLTSKTQDLSFGLSCWTEDGSTQRSGQIRVHKGYHISLRKVLTLRKLRTSLNGIEF